MDSGLLLAGRCTDSVIVCPSQLKKSSVSVLDRLETRAEVGTNDRRKRGESIPTYDVNLYHMG